MSGVGVVHYHLLTRPCSVPTALGPAPHTPIAPRRLGGTPETALYSPPPPPLTLPLGPQPAEMLSLAVPCDGSGRPDAPPPLGGRRWLLRARAAGSESTVPCSSPDMADGSRLRRDSSAPSRTADTPPRPRSTAASPLSHLFFFCSSTTALGSHWRSPLLPAARSPQHRDPPQQRGLSDSVSLLSPGFRHQCNTVRRSGRRRHSRSQLPGRLAHTCPVSSTVVGTQGHCAQSPQLVGASGQLGKEQTLPCAEDLFSRHGVGLGQPHSTSLNRTCSVDAELPGVFPG